MLLDKVATISLVVKCSTQC